MLSGFGARDAGLTKESELFIIEKMRERYRAGAGSADTGTGELGISCRKAE